MWRWLVYIAQYWLGLEGGRAKRATEIALLALAVAALAAFVIAEREPVRWAGFALGLGLFLVLPAVRFKRLEDVIYPVLKIQCGEHVPNSIRRAQKISIAAVDPQSGQKTAPRMVAADLFGFNLTNQGTSPVHNCEALLVRISSPHGVLFRRFSRLPAEPSLQGKNDRFDLWHNKPQLVTLCAITTDNKVVIGTGNVSSRHADPEITFNEIGEYFFDVQFSGMVDDFGIKTIERRFTFRWGGDGPASSIAGPSQVPANA